MNYDSAFQRHLDIILTATEVVEQSLLHNLVRILIEPNNLRLSLASSATEGSTLENLLCTCTLA